MQLIACLLSKIVKALNMICYEKCCVIRSLYPMFQFWWLDYYNVITYSTLFTIIPTLVSVIEAVVILWGGKKETIVELETVVS